MIKWNIVGAKPEDERPRQTDVRLRVRDGDLCFELWSFDTNCWMTMARICHDGSASVGYLPNTCKALGIEADGLGRIFKPATEGD